MDVFGMDTAPDDDIGGAAGSGQPIPNVGSWFQRGSASDAALSDRGVGVPINAMLDRVRESDGLPFEDEEEEEDAN
jgi:hypothetical protein